MDMKDLYSHRIEIRKERRRKTEEKVVTFDQVGHRAVQRKNNEEETFEIPPRVQDSLSSLYFSEHSRFRRPARRSPSISMRAKERQAGGRSLSRQRVTTPPGPFKRRKSRRPSRKKAPLKQGPLFYLVYGGRQAGSGLDADGKQAGVITVLLSSQREGKEHSLTAEAF